MNLMVVSRGRTEREFIDLPKKLYSNDPDWVSPLDKEIKAVFDPSRNVFFQHGICKRWILANDRRQTIGRIAAFINFKKSHKYSLPTGDIGFFECINNKEAAHFLFSTAEAWLKENQMEAMEGPVNFGENDKYWGLLIQGFKPPSLGMNYNPPYYIELFESFGFEKFYDQLTNYLDATVPLPDRFIKIADWVMKKPGYAFRHFDKRYREKFFDDFQEIYNDAWSDFVNFAPIEIEIIRESFRQMKPVMDEKIIWFAYHNDEPIAFVLCLPDVNQLLKHVKGKMNLIGKLKFAWYRKTRKVDRLRIIIMGCKKKFQNHGIESALIRCLQQEVLPRNTIKGVELAWVGDFNAKMLAVHEATGAKKDKVHRTYRFVFNKPAQPSVSRQSYRLSSINASK